MTRRSTGQVVPRRRLVRQQRGVTFVELIVVLMVIAIVSAIALPSFRNMTENNALRRVTNDLVMAIKTARADAVNLRTDVNLAPQDGQNWSNGWEIEVTGHETKVFSGSSSIQITESTDVTSIDFHRNGTVDPIVTFTLCASQRGRELEVSRLGRITNTEITCP